MTGRTGSKMRVRRISSFTLWIAVSLGIACETQKSTAVDIDNGDLVTVVRANRGHELVVEKHGIQATLRLVGIYTFAASVNEKNDITVYANLSKDFVEKELQGKTVTLILEREALDKRGRYLGFIEVDGIDFNERMIEVGHAVLYTEYPFSREAAYIAAEAEPRKNGRGMWGGRASSKRVKALRTTWAAVRRNSFGSPVKDPLLHE
ncbi:MAG: thermonuclease family protein [Myxococcota bacterium]